MNGDDDSLEDLGKVLLEGNDDEEWKEDCNARDLFLVDGNDDVDEDRGSNRDDGPRSLELE